ncbi:hypothetical protein N7493_000207 [Penicillium malachiteum]|uniref:Uncharacterized protein n=1 Tax=Penicillium malachiteum TaxID=1324776 RepID=A0AAD6N176_9EURO|nr:hypothetical protein N7493_000207 [Penicillium malachiteum]
MAPTKDKATPSKADKVDKTDKTDKTNKADKVVKTQASMRSGRNRKFGNVMSEENFRFMWICLEGVHVDYRTVAGKLGISYSAANQRYYNLRDYFKHLAELEGRPQPATVQPSGRAKGAKKPAKKTAKKGTKATTKGKGKGKAAAKSDDDDNSIDLTQDDDNVDLTRDDGEDLSNLSEADEHMSGTSSPKGELYALIKQEIDEAETMFRKAEHEQTEAGPSAPANDAEQTEEAGQAKEVKTEQRNEDDLDDYEDAKDVQDAQDEEDVDVA